MGVGGEAQQQAWQPKGRAYFGCPTCCAVTTLPVEPGQDDRPWCVHHNNIYRWSGPVDPSTDWTQMVRVKVAEVTERPAGGLRGYRVYVMDGPAEGWGYVVSVPPEPTIAIAPMPEGASHVHGEWMRVLPDDEPQWPGARRYELAEPIPPPGEEPAERVTGDGDLLCPYRVVD
jgi:hypothetical protein